MSVEMYDYAVRDKLRGVFSNTHYAPTDEAFKRCAEANEGKVKLPMISIFRPGAFEIDTRNYNMPDFFRGRNMWLKAPELGEGQSLDDVYPKGNIAPEAIRNLRSLPVVLRYQMDVWGTRMDVVNEMTKEIIFWLVEYPHIVVAEPISEIGMEFSIEFEDGITDNTDIMGFQDRGKLYRNSLDFFIRDARLFSYLDIEKLVKNIEIEVYYVDDELEDYPGEMDPDDTIEISGDEE